MSKHKNKKQRLFCVEICREGPKGEQIWIIKNRFKVLFDHHSKNENVVIYDAHGFLKKATYKAGGKKYLTPYLVRAMDFKTFVENYDRYKEASKKGENIALKEVILTLDDYEVFKELLYGLDDIPYKIRLENDIKYTKLRISQVDGYIKSKEYYLKRIQEELQSYEEEKKKLEDEYNSKTKRLDEVIRNLITN